MQRLILALTLLLFLAAGYLFLQPKPQVPPMQDKPPVVSVQERQAAQSHINSLTRQAAEQTLPMDAADHFVTGNQLLQLPISAQARTAAIKLETTDSPDGVTAFAASRAPVGTSATPHSSTPATAANQLRLQELLNDPDQAESEIFYLHSVNDADRQGLWGIIHKGLINTFTRGIRVDERSRLLSVDIPGDADEKLPDQRSSWLGSLLKRKVETTWVYNYEQGLLGQNPNVIHPGQQLIIVRFDEEELINIYNHFTEQTPAVDPHQ